MILQRDKEGRLRPIARIAINRDLADMLIEITGKKQLNLLVESLLRDYLKEKELDRQRRAGLFYLSSLP